MSDEIDYHYYDSTNENQVLYAPSGPTLIRIILAILLRVGFTFMHIGSIPINNVNLIFLQNIVDICWVTIVYLLLGVIIAYNGDTKGLVGEGYWIGDTNVDKDEAIIGWTAVQIASAICTTAIVGRTHIVGYLVIGLLLTGILQPFLIHWIWTPEGWMSKNKLIDTDVRFLDYGGSTIVHLVGGLSGFIGCATLGRRMLRLESIDSASVSAGSPGMVFGGQLLVFVGLQSLSLPNAHIDNLKKVKTHHYHIYINNLLAASSCSLIVVLFHFLFTSEEFNHWTVMRCVQATVSGLIVISAGVDNYSPIKAIGLGSIGSVVFYFISKLIFRSALEDYCNIVVVHLISSILGSMLVPLFDFGETEGINQILLNFAWHLICLATIIVFVGVVMLVAFVLLQYFGLLRNRSEYLNHLRASIAAERNPGRSYLQRLFRPEDDPVYLQPGSNRPEQFKFRDEGTSGV